MFRLWIELNSWYEAYFLFLYIASTSLFTSRFLYIIVTTSGFRLHINRCCRLFIISCFKVFFKSQASRKLKKKKKKSHFASKIVYFGTKDSLLFNREISCVVGVLLEMLITFSSCLSSVTWFLVFVVGLGCFLLLLRLVFLCDVPDGGCMDESWRIHLMCSHFLM